MKDAGVLPSVQREIPGKQAPAGLWVCEMVTTRALIERNPKTLVMVRPDEEDPVRSVQLYGVSPHVTAQAVEFLIRENYAHHIDLNFGCPAPKVTRRGGGSALPWKLDLFRDIVRQAVEAARKACEHLGFQVPITGKMRLGIDDDHMTFKDAARIAEDEGISAITLHARTTAQYYSGAADWNFITECVKMLDIPVFGNGDVFTVDDASAMLKQTKCAGVAIGRGAQGRPWIFRDMAAFMHGKAVHTTPSLGDVVDIVRRHAQLAVEHFADEEKALRDMRGDLALYFKGFSLGGTTRFQLSQVSSLDDLEKVFATWDLSQPYPDVADSRRGRAGGQKRPHLPERWLESRFLSESEEAKIHLAEVGVSGG
ncbi:MAG: tRNA dihydrouridine synthase DusB, partial [Actinomycetaceae bacterium]|nr:tRNA dihydrouridine synthase DusB [Actinomycetaceae bacterium]